MPADGQMHRTTSGDTIRVPAGLDYPAALVGLPVRSKIVEDPPWVAGGTEPPDWQIGHYSGEWPYDLAVSGSLWVPKYMTVTDIEGIVDCPPPNGQGAAAALNGAGPVVLTQQDAGPPFPRWADWAGTVNGWTAWLNLGLVPPAGSFYMNITKLIGGTTYCAYEVSNLASLLRPGPTVLPSMNLPGFCGGSGPLAGTYCAHSGQLTLHLGDQT